MSKAKKTPGDGDIVEETTVTPKTETYEVAVLSAIREREAFCYEQFDHVDVKYLWDDNYRVNCYKDQKIKASHFVSYSKHEGIYQCIPEV